MMPLLFLLASCVGQDRGGTSPGTGASLLGRVFSKAHASGSLEYWGVCDFKEPYPDYPKLQALPNQEGSPIELLREMFSVDPEMKVSQDADGKIRMVEEDVPSDLLDVRIHHLQFSPKYHGPDMAEDAILQSPEVVAFRKEHNLGPKSHWGPRLAFPSHAFAPTEPIVSGDLHDVTVRQALDYILETFSGFWLYENCKSTEGGRMIYLSFLENGTSASPPQR
jgi:hypothetical protein